MSRAFTKKAALKFNTQIAKKNLRELEVVHKKLVASMAKKIKIGASGASLKKTEAQIAAVKTKMNQFNKQVV